MLFVIPVFFLSAADQRNDHRNDHHNDPNSPDHSPCNFPWSPDYSQSQAAVVYGVNVFYKQKYIEGSLAKPLNLNQRIVRPQTNG